MTQKIKGNPELVMADAAPAAPRARIAITREQAALLAQIDQRTSEVIARAQSEVKNAVVLLCAGHAPEGSRFIGIEEDESGAPHLVVQLPAAPDPGA